MILKIAFRFWIGVLVCSASVLSAAGSQAASPDFNTVIRPILSSHCFACHGPDSSKRQPRRQPLRLDVRKDAERALVPGGDGKILLLERIHHTDPNHRMPPPESKLELDEAEIQLLEAWIAGGAAYADHWAFQTPVKPRPPASTKWSDWVRQPLDAFVAERLERLNRQPAPEADRATLLRRLSFDLTGMPPSPEEMEAFVKDPHPQAYENLVDRLLRSEAYGERLAMEWMDVARYADTYGYQVDRDREVWPWRDWVIDAFNRNLPYDDFITWQVAGDLLPEPTEEQMLATTFSRLHQQKVEGGSVEEEFRVEYVADRTHTFGTAFLGLTLECARCHDHKYDPVTQEEYYRLFAYFNNIDEAGLYSFFTPSVPTPTMALPDAAQRERLKELSTQRKSLEARLVQVLAQASGEVPVPTEWSLPAEVARFDFESLDKNQFQNGIEGMPPANNSDRNRWLELPEGGHAVELTGDDAIELKQGNFKRHESFSIGLRMWVPGPSERAVVFHRSRAWTDAASRGYEMLLIEGRPRASLIHFWPGNAISVEGLEPLPMREWIHLTMTYDGTCRASSIRIYLNGKLVETRVVRDALTKEITGGGGDHITIGERFRDRGFKGGKVDDFRVFQEALTAAEVRVLAGLDPLKDPVDPILVQHVRARGDSTVRELLKQRGELIRQTCELQNRLREIMVMREMTPRRPSFVLHRGAYDARTREVEPGTPAMLPPLPAGAPNNRLGLARWLTDPQHPLTARVTVNRYWKMLFGRGLVGTPEDFGSQGTPPDHQALLDWLTCDFVDSGWDLKRLLRNIVLSSTYRQSSTVAREFYLADPENRWLARGPRHRLPAEMIRDNALCASGLIVSKLGGPSVRPYEVEVSFKPVKRGKGDDLYRRSLYTYWKRTGPAPVMMTFDAAKRDVCSVKRDLTSTPLQALVLLNDPQMVEASRALAFRILQTGGSEREALRNVFLLLVTREPAKEELEVLESLYWSEKKRRQADPEGTRQYLAVGDWKGDLPEDPSNLAALAVVAQTVMNLDACVVKR